MKRIIFLFLVLSFIFTISAVAGDELFIKSSSFKANKYVPDQLVVKFKPGVGQDVINSINKKTGAKLIKVSKFADFNILKIPQGKTVKEMVEKYKKHVQVEYAEPNFIAHAHMVPNDSFYSPYQWHLDNSVYGGINMELAWDISTGYGVIVAVVDTGVAYEDYSEVIFLNRNKTKTIYYSQAPDLVGTDFVAGYDFVNDDAHPNDDEGHGTHVTGTIAQRTNNGIGVAGVAFDCSIMPVKVLDSSGSGTYTDIADGIYFAADNEADVINMSLGGSFDSSILKDAVAYAYGKGVTIVCSSGNDGASNSIGFPAAYDDYCIAVGATRYDEAISYYSNGGTSLDITAPGGDVTIDQNNDGYGDGVLQQTHDGNDYTSFGYYFYQGTSMSAPHVSGVAALLISVGVAITPNTVREALQTTAEDHGEPGWDSWYGHGIVDAYAALNYIGGGDPPPVNAAPVAVAGEDLSGKTGDVLTFNGTASYDADGSIISYEWNFGDGEFAVGDIVTHSFASAGVFTVTLIVTDDGLLTGTDSVSVFISEPQTGSALSVADITVTLNKMGRNYQANANVKVVDESGVAVSDALVSSQWVLNGSALNTATGTTGSDGIAVCTSSKIKAKSGDVFEITITNISKSGYTYDESANVETSDSVTVD